MEKPKHYKMKIDVIDFCMENGLDFMVGNVIKYVVRYKLKGGLRDLEKAKAYIERMMEKQKKIEAVYPITRGSLKEGIDEKEKL